MLIHLDSSAIRRNRDKCSQSEPCAEEKHCACWVVEPVGEKILEDLVAWLPKAVQERPEETWKLLELDAKRENDRLAGEKSDIPEILEIAEKVIAWGCAYPRLDT